MKVNDIIDIFVAYADTQGGKYRPVLIIKLSKEKAWILKITSKYKEKSKNIRKYYYPIFDWQKYNLNVASYIDTRSYLVVNIKDLNIKKIRRHFSLKDLKGLNDFIKKNQFYK